MTCGIDTMIESHWQSRALILLSECCLRTRVNNILSISSGLLLDLLLLLGQNTIRVLFILIVCLQLLILWLILIVITYSCSDCVLSACQ